MELEARITAILLDSSLDDETVDSSRAEEVEKLIPRFGWPAVQESMLAGLRSREPERWRLAAEVLWGAALDRREVDVDRVIAHLCLRYPPGPEEDNLAWSITSKLKGRGYLSAYDPLDDPGGARVLAELLREAR